MIKPTSSFKMSAQSKRFLARELDPHKRGELKRGMIQAQLVAEQRPKKERATRGSGPIDNGPQTD